MRFRPLLLPPLLLIPALGCQSTSDSTAPPQVGPGSEEIENAGDPGIDSLFAGRSGGALASVEPSAVSGAGVAVAPANFDPGAWLTSVQNSQEFLEERAQSLDLIRDRERKLSDQYVASAQAALERADVEAALADYARALDILPSNEAARAGFVSARALLGDDSATAAQILADTADLESVKRAEARIAAGNAMAEGDAARRRGDYEGAIAKYREAQVILAYNPLINDDEIDAQVLDRKLESTLAERDADLEERASESVGIAEELRSQAELEAKNYRFNVLSQYYSQANRAFVDERYDTAEDLAEQILRIDPGNAAALEMRDIAVAARLQKRDEALLKDYREQWQMTMQELEQEAIPQLEPLVYDDIGRYAEVKDRRPYEVGVGSGGIDPEVERLSNILRTTRVPARFGSEDEGTPLSTVAEYFNRVSGLNFLISPDAADLDVEVSLNLPERPLLSLLKLIDEFNEELAWKIEDGTVKFVTEEENLGDLQLRYYEVRDLVRPPKDFQAPEINVIPSEGIEYPEEDPREPEATVITGDDLSSLIEENIAPDSWGDAEVSVTETGTLIVYQTAEVHAEINALLDELREAAGLMVNIQARFLKVSDNFLEDIGVDFRGLGAPGLGANNFFNDFGLPGSLNNQIGQDTDLGAFYDNGQNGEVKARVENLFDVDLGGEITNAGGLSFQWTYLNDLQLEMVLRAVAKSERVELVTAPSILVFNTARSNLQVLNQVAYVQDYSVEIATAAAIADPQIQVVQDGVVLDVRPVISADRRFITLDLRPTVATLQRPIEEFSTSLATTGTVTIQLPQLELQRIRTVVSVPDGGTVLLGGLKLFEEQELTSGVPILNKIPIVNFFFERKGNYVSKQKTLILMRASIVITNEFAPTDAQLGVLPGSGGSN